MAIVSGVLSDFIDGHMEGMTPQLILTPSGPGFGPTQVYAPRPIAVYPDENGFFEVDLVPTVDLQPEVWLNVALRWGSGNRVPLPFRLVVPLEGGNFAELIKVKSNATNVWLGIEPPEDPTIGTWWSYTGPTTAEMEYGDLHEWDGK